LKTSGAFNCILHSVVRRHTLSIISYLRLWFFFSVTLGRDEIVAQTTFIHEPRKLPVVLSPQEVARLLNASPRLKYKAALSVAYGAGLRAAEVVSLKVSDIDSKRMIIRVEQGKGGRDRNVMLSPSLLDLLRTWWRAARPQGWLFPGRDNSIGLVMRCRSCRHRQEGVFAHAAAQFCHPSVGTERRCACDSGSARSCQAGLNRALYAGCHQDDPAGHEAAGAWRPPGNGLMTTTA
jgi:site-specific recombinase XerC